MPKHMTGNIVQVDPLEHPAVKAWIKLQPGRVGPEGIETLKKEKKSGVYRLEGVGPEGSAVIAKRCRQVTAMIERAIYEEILPRLPLTTLRYYGFVEEPGGKSCWLFLEDAGKEAYSPRIEEHRALVARWLGRMHTSAACVAAAARLPDRGPDHYLEHLRLARDTIRRKLAISALGADDLMVLESVASQCDVLESRWSQVERFCEGMPRTLVHGDFVPKNVRVRTDQSGVALLPLDWETAGWGVPAADLVRVDLVAYRSTVRQSWPRLDIRDIRQMANFGRIFRWLAAVSWASESLEYERIERPMRSMRICEAGMADAIQAAEWED